MIASKKPRTFTALALLMAAPLAISQSACSNPIENTTMDDTTLGEASSVGLIELRVATAANLPVSQVKVVLNDATGKLMHSSTLSLDPTQPSTSMLLALPAGLGYTLSLSASDPNGTQCSGNTVFNVVADNTVEIPLTLRCVIPGTDRNGKGTVKVEIEVESEQLECPEISMISALPDHTKIGEPIKLSSTASVDGASFAWSATSGSFSDPNQANTTYTCSQAGAASLTLAVQTSPACKKEHSIEVQCDLPDSAATQEVEINFEAQVGNDPFECSRTYTGLGSTGDAKASPNDFRFFVHDLVLIKADGTEAPVTIEDRDLWQGSGIALVDFEGGPTARCFGGSEGTNTKVTGTVAKGDYVGLKFRTGVPTAYNHLDPSTLKAPLNASGMVWSWLSGFKFIKVELGAHTLHVGSTACSGTPPDDMSCAKSNRSEIILSDFDPNQDIVVADMAGVFSKVDLSTSQSCHSSGDSCISLFEAVGIHYEDGSTLSAQQLFRKK